MPAVCVSVAWSAFHVVGSARLLVLHSNSFSAGRLASSCPIVKLQHRCHLVFMKCMLSGQEHVLMQPMEIYVDDETKLTLHGLVQHYVMLNEEEKNRKLNDLLDALDFNQVRMGSSLVLLLVGHSAERCKCPFGTIDCCISFYLCPS